MKFSIFTGEKNLCISHGQVFVMTIFQSCWEGATGSWVTGKLVTSNMVSWCLAQGHNMVPPMMSKSRTTTIDLESDALPLRHRTPTTSVLEQLASLHSETPVTA